MGQSELILALVRLVLTFADSSFTKARVSSSGDDTYARWMLS